MNVRKMEGHWITVFDPRSSTFLKFIYKRIFGFPLRALHAYSWSKSREDSHKEATSHFYGGISVFLGKEAWKFRDTLYKLVFLIFAWKGQR
ncbi:hypothetical protein A4A49_20495 [Nicotiana attenuata]|uniref:Uncharacterized protein n=1 Tax=Nicotiana attenuata TaxID=49451 RepID=A0A1J6J2E8_NICAT|nr:hypothetical protein A4A49_20495 [Nicotiana attenuata]